MEAAHHEGTGERQELDEAVVQAALDDLDDDAYRRGSCAIAEDYDRAVVRHALTIPEAEQLLGRAVREGIVDNRVPATGSTTAGVLSPERMESIREYGSVPEALDLFLERAGRYPLLDATRERELARAIEAGERFRRGQATGPEQEAIRLRALRAKEEFICSNIRLVVSICKDFRGRGLDFPDLVQYGMLGLVRAVEKFDWRKGFKFSTYATWWIRQSIQRSLANYSRLIRLPVHQVDKLSKIRRVQSRLRGRMAIEPTPSEIAAELDLDPAEVAYLLDAAMDVLSLDAPLGEDSNALRRGDLVPSTEPPLHELAEANERREAVRAALASLAYRERRIIEMRFGLGDEQTRTLEEVGAVFSVTRERVRQVEKATKEKLEPLLREQGIDDTEEDVTD